ncbi:molybdate ABC transporter permease subunit [Methylovorus sp. MP688]|uniref:molybdate ABC transporter permease subunit n=1 Tax=Methylovorus sp. (strain MP688) TaxID=887061 RepID=UPI0001EC4894|nr:molybdate ABC transporter permease subunit [Methylovorus sp. MP688]ADQ85429.1 molybdate ABC transporter, inner membrane subunit [Methylovorus sp. MP688]
MSILQLTPEEMAALWLSAKVAFFCTLLILIPGVLLGWGLARKRFFGKALLDSVVHLPLVLPPVVPGFLLLLLFGSQGFLGKWLQETFGISIAFTWMGAVVASAIMALPLMVRSARLAVSQVDRGLELAAQSLGAHPLRVFFSITLPLALPGILTGMVLAFSRSLGEFGATITFVGNIEGETRTLPLAIYTYTQIPGGDMPALRLVLLSLLLAFAALYFSNVMEQRALRRIGSGDDRA